MNSLDITLAQTDILLAVLGVVLILCFAYMLYLIFVRMPRERIEANRVAYREGWEWCLRVHRIEPGAVDRDVLDSYEGVAAVVLAPTWEQGYLDALETHGLPVEERDSQELWHNKYADADRNATIQQAANQVSTAVVTSQQFRRY